MCGRDMTEVGHAYAGDIIVAPKLAAETGDTLSITGKVEAAAFKFPNSQYRIAIEAENRGDEEKLYTFIEKACKADPTMSIDRDEETGQTIISPWARRRYRCCSTAWRTVPKLRPRALNPHSVSRDYSSHGERSGAATRNRLAVPVSMATAGCAWSRSLGPTVRATAMSSWTRSWAAAFRAR